MATHEARRFLGPKDGWALMEEVSGRDWGELATKVDLDHLGAPTWASSVAGKQGRDHDLPDLMALAGHVHARFDVRRI